MPRCKKICESCGQHDEYYTNAKKCNNCGEMALQLLVMNLPDCSARKLNPGGLCVYHMCSFKEGHKGRHECKCGWRWD